MPSVKDIDSPIRGLDVSFPGELLDPRQSPNMQNMALDRGILSQRVGGSSLGATLSERIVQYFELVIGASTFMVRVGLTKVQLLDKGAGTWSSIANGVLAASADDYVDYAFPNLSGSKIAVFTNGVDAIRKYTGTGNDADLGGSPPVARFLESFGGYLLLGYVVDGSSFRQRVQWSDAGDIETWTGGNTGSKDLVEDGEDITGMKVYGDAVAVHKSTAIYLGYLVSTGSVFRFDRKETGEGAIAPGTIQNLPTGEQIFLGRTGLRLFNGITAPIVPSGLMDELRDEINPEQVHRSTSVLRKELDEYWVAVPTGNQTDPETIYKYNYKTGEVYKDARTSLSALGTFKKTTQETWDSDGESWISDTKRWNSIVSLALHPRLIAGDSTGVSVEEDGSTDDAGTAIESYWVSKDFTARDFNPKLPKDTLMRWQGLQVWAKGNNVDLQYSIDSGLNWIDITTLALSVDFPTQSNPGRGWFDVLSEKIRFRLKNFTVSETFSFKQMQILAEIRERMAA